MYRMFCYVHFFSYYVPGTLPSGYVHQDLQLSFLEAIEHVMIS